MKIRPSRIAEEIRRDLSMIIRNNVKDPRVAGLVSITDVEVSGDLHYATIYISKYGSDEERQAALKALEKASGYLRNELGKKLNLRFTPELIFKLDDSLAYGAKIETLLTKINNDSQEK